MWTASQLKRNAREKLKAFYWNAVLVCFIGAIFSGSFSGGITSKYNYMNSVGQMNDASYTLEDYSSLPQSFADIMKGYEVPGFEYSYNTSPALIALIAFAVILGLILGLAFLIFLTNPIMVGVIRFFVRSASGEKAKLGEVFYAFRSGHYLNIVKVMFIRDIKLFLWGLLLLIPGIVKSYEYIMIPFILSEDPGMDSQEVFRLTREMTYGDKGNIFLLYLSFIGWYLLVGLAGLVCVLSFTLIGLLIGVLLLYGGTLFIMPYINSTSVELYFALKAKIFYGKQGGYDEVC